MIIELHKVLNLLWVIFSYFFSVTAAAAPVLVSFDEFCVRVQHTEILVQNNWTNVRIIFISMRGFVWERDSVFRM